MSFATVFLPAVLYPDFIALYSLALRFPPPEGTGYLSCRLDVYIDTCIHDKETKGNSEG